MNLSRKMKVKLFAPLVMMGFAATANAVDLEFYFPVAVGGAAAEGRGEGFEGDTGHGEEET